MRFKNLNLLILLVALVLPACGGATTQKLTLNIGWEGAPDSFNPGVGTYTESYTIYDLVYSSLYVYKTDATFALDAAESATPSADEKKWTFKIRDGVTFSDGQPLTAEDVVYSFRLYASHPDDFPYLPGYTSYIEDVIATSANEVVIKLKEPIPNLESQLFSLYILPKHIWATEDAVTFENLEMVGSGPFKVVEYVPGELVRLAANESYYGGKPPVDEIVFKTYSDSNSLAQALISGDVDMITAVPLEALDQLKSAENIAVVNGSPQSPDLTDIIINQVVDVNCPLLDSVCSGHPALRDRTVRQALAYATNKQEIIDQVMKGLADPGLTLVPKGLGDFYNSELKDYPYDIARANKILDDAGYLDTDGDGVRELPGGGRPLNFRLQWELETPRNELVAQLLQATWQQIGIQTQLEALNSETLSNNCCPAFDYDILVWGWGADPDPAFLLSVPLGDGISSGRNETGYVNEAYNTLFKNQATQLDPQVRRNIIWDMQKILLQDVVYIIPFYSQAVQAYRTDKFTGWSIDDKTLSLQDPEAIFKLRPVNK